MRRPDSAADHPHSEAMRLGRTPAWRTEIYSFLSLRLDPSPAAGAGVSSSIDSQMGGGSALFCSPLFPCIRIQEDPINSFSRREDGAFCNFSLRFGRKSMKCGSRRDGAAPTSRGFFVWFASMVSCDFFFEGLVMIGDGIVEVVRCKRP